ncbi:MAG: hypothetical protein K8R23_08335 [Chthoniobacter sp.]|nr:hypothetical protein [Chthoniobacter sp.]
MAKRSNHLSQNLDLPLEGSGEKKAAARGKPGRVTTLPDSRTYHVELPKAALPTRAERRQGRLLFFLLLLALIGLSYALYYSLQHV